MKYYLCQFIPPRADFLTTLSAAEQQWMAAHGDFLNDLMAQGLIVAHGPVLDPAGAYGMSLYRIADDQDIAALTAQDPVVRHGAGHYVHHPMPHLASRS